MKHNTKKSYIKIARVEHQQVPIVKIISEHKRRWRTGGGNTPVAPSFKRVMAIVNIDGKHVTRHCDTSDGVMAYVRS